MKISARRSRTQDAPTIDVTRDQSRDMLVVSCGPYEHRMSGPLIYSRRLTPELIQVRVSEIAKRCANSFAAWNAFCQFLGENGFDVAVLRKQVPERHRDQIGVVA